MATQPIGMSKTSEARLLTCHPALQAIVRAVAEQCPLVVVEGHRGKDKQDAAFAAGNSQTPWPRSMHNAEPSLAVDLAPLEGGSIPWPDQVRGADQAAQTERLRRARVFHLFCGRVLGTASALGIGLRWGGDWDGDNDLDDQKLIDLPHFELMGQPWPPDAA